MAAKKSKSEQIVSDMIRAINHGEYKPNETIIEAQIAEKYGVSTTPAREALNYLSAEGYIDKAPHRGYRVKGITYGEVKMLLEYRYALENTIVSIAIRRIKPDAIRDLIDQTSFLLQHSDEEIFAQYRAYNYHFHVGLAETIDNKYLLRDYAKVMSLLWRAMAFGVERPQVRNSMHRHINLCQAILDGDEQGARELVYQYMVDTETRVIGNLVRSSGP